MTPLFSNHGRQPKLLLLALALFVQAPAREDEELVSLLNRSPFDAAAGTRAPQTMAPALEFRGYAYDGDQVSFSIGCPDAQGRVRTQWVQLREPQADYVVRGFNPESDSLQVEYRGRVITLQLKRSRVQLLAAGWPSPDAPEAADTKIEREQLQAIAAAVRHRQQLRRASAQQEEPDES